MRVLFVDDEPNILDSIRRQLRKSYDIVTATSGNAVNRIVVTQLMGACSGARATVSVSLCIRRFR